MKQKSPQITTPEEYLSPMPFQFHDPRQERIYKKLALLGPGPAKFYYDYCLLINNKNLFKTTSHLICHLLREVDNAILTVLELIKDREERINIARKNKEKEISDKVNKFSSNPTKIAKSWLSDLKQPDSSDYRREAIANIIKILEIPSESGIEKEWSEIKFHSLAHRNALAPPRPIDKDIEKQIDRIEGIWDTILSKFEEQFFLYHSQINELLVKESPSKKEVKVLKNYIPNNFNSLSYLFSKLENPQWVKLLKEGGYFDSPTELFSNNDSALDWPQGAFLARIASKAPQEVSEIMLAIPESDNYYVHEYLIEAACNMPAELSAKWAKTEISYIESRENLLHSILEKKYSQLIIHLADGKQTTEALQLTNVLLDLYPVQKEFLTGRYIVEYKSRVDFFEYEEIIKTILPSLIENAQERVLNLFCDFLKRDIDFQLRYSIEDSPHNYDHQIENGLINQIRDIADVLIQKKGKLILSILENRPFMILKRVALYLRRKYPKVDPKGTEQLLLTENYLEYYGHELYILLSESFSALPEKVQNRYFDYIENCDVSDWRENREKSIGRELSEKECLDCKQYRQFRLLKPIENYLEGKWRQEYIKLEKKYGSSYQEAPEITSWVGPTSPLSDDDFKQMSVVEIVSYLKSWQPSRSYRTPSPEGLGRVFAKAVEARAQDFAANAWLFKEIEPTYLRNLLHGLGEAIKENVYKWKPILDLCVFIVKQPREIAGRNQNAWDDFNSDWVGTRKETAYLLRKGLDYHKNQIPIEFRNKVWDILKILAEDPSPAPDEEKAYNGSSMMVAINSVRGVAMEAVVCYALWIYNHKQAKSFASMPEVREVLEKHLDINIEPSLAIRTIYGLYFPQLQLLDKKWAIKNLKNIFPEDEQFVQYRRIAWDSYITYCEPYIDVFKLLKNDYLKAIDLIGTSENKTLTWADPDQSLAKHIMVFYGRYGADLDDPDEMINKFYQKASDSVCRYAIWVVERGFVANKTNLQVSARFQQLWEYRLKCIENSGDVLAHSEELAAFGGWFTYGQLDEEWLLDNLQKTLHLLGEGRGIRFEGDIVERLVALSSRFPLESIQCLRLLIANAKERWEIHHLAVDAKKILTDTLQSTDKAVKKEAEAVTNILISRGFAQLGELLKD